jgi:hypothetical protein
MLAAPKAKSAFRTRDPDGTARNPLARPHEFPKSDFLERQQKNAYQRRLVHELERMGYDGKLEPKSAA